MIDLQGTCVADDRFLAAGWSRNQNFKFLPIGVQASSEKSFPYSETPRGRGAVLFVKHCIFGSYVSTVVIS
jgi:hypothetical protein